MKGETKMTRYYREYYGWKPQNIKEKQIVEELKGIIQPSIYDKEKLFDKYGRQIKKKNKDINQLKINYG